ncbi:hypothetical protein [Methylobacter sp.]|uniref:hypothetical protein n=1 Tax=Methylobacter sp. TaxID=2051955 RepID=UPI001210B65D|nr:hypothetical protein [Methylobacter sp.]TAK59483.1 MAG: hypothetical protein EPO18_20180 [Methylobacter sp.]
MNVKAILRRAQRYHILDHSGPRGGRLCKGGWSDLFDFAKNRYLGRVATDHNWKDSQHWECMGEQIEAQLRRLA